MKLSAALTQARLWILRMRGCRVTAGIGTRIAWTARLRSASVISFGKHCRIGPGVHIRGNVALGDGCIIERDCALIGNLRLGAGVFANIGTLLYGDIDVGDRSMFGPRCILTTAHHPHDGNRLVTGATVQRPIRIENDVWLGSAVCVVPGTRIGAGAIIGAGSVAVGAYEAGGTFVGARARAIDARAVPDRGPDATVPAIGRAEAVGPKPEPPRTDG